jgi:hypothetical protein
MITLKGKRVKLGKRKPHPLDIEFIAPHMTPKELREYEFSEEEFDRFRRRSLFLESKDKQDVLLPGMEKPWAGHMLISGATGSGKTWLAKEILRNDDRPVYFVSDIQGRDPSLKVLKRQGRLIRLYEPMEIHNCFILFDDVTDPVLMAWRDKLYEQGRHHKISVITINHSVREGQRISRVVRDSKWICLFPQANKAIISAYLRDVLQLRARFKNALLRKAEEDGRYLFIHTNYPNFFMTSKSVIPY